MGLTFKKATIADLDTLNAISLASKRYWDYPESWIQNWKNDLTVTLQELNNHSILIAELSNEIIGFCAVSECDKYYEIEHLWILPKFIGNGYGELLLNESLRRTIKKSKKITVIADPNATTFYEKNGFVL